MIPDLDNLITDLRAKAEAASHPDAHIPEYNAFMSAAKPAAIFTILDALDEARGELERRYDPGYIEDLLRVVSATDQNWREGQAELATLRAEVEQYKTILADPVAVYVNMLRGTIATPSELAELRARVAEVEASLNL